MLINLHVKNLALIDEEEITFEDGLNILSGETGAGKSIILGALGIAIGQKASKDVLRDPSKDGLAEAVFRVTNDRQRQALKGLDIEAYEDEVILSRRITDSRTVARINGETVPAARLKDVGSIFIDIYGQNEHQSLLKSSKHLAMLDAFGHDQIADLKQKVADTYRIYSALQKEYDASAIDKSAQLREADYLTHEINEIEEAQLKEGEDEQLEADYRRMSHAEKIIESLNESYACITEDGAASDQIGTALRAISSVESYDAQVAALSASLSEIDSLLSDFERDLGSYIEEAAYDPEAFDTLTRRLDLINDLKAKYGNSIPEILGALEEKKKRLQQLEDYDSYLANLQQQLDASLSDLNAACKKLSAVRKEYAKKLTKAVEKSLGDLNFLDTKFSMAFSQTDHPTANGSDTAEFYISVNPGEPMRPLREVASGGELSRIMLALKTVLAQKEDTVDTLIFDEIDAGISGRTAQAVARKLHVVTRNQQVICITHLPQIAAMADAHFLIDKSVVDDRTVSGIRRLSEEDRVQEIARMMAGGTISDSVLESARELMRQER